MCKRWHIRCHSLCHVQKNNINKGVFVIFFIKNGDFLLLSKNITKTQLILLSKSHNRGGVISISYINKERMVLC